MFEHITTFERIFWLLQLLLQLVPFAVVVFRCSLPTICPGAPESIGLSIAIIQNNVSIILLVYLDYVPTFEWID